jgi:AraC-like DNA-binding protein
MSLLIEQTGADVLAEVLDSLKLRGRIFCRCRLSAPWALGFAEGDFSHFHVIERGTCWLRLNGTSEPIALTEGDLLLVPRGHRYELCDEVNTPPVALEALIGRSQGGLRAVIEHGGGGKEVKLLCGSFEWHGPQPSVFLSLLPEWIRVTRRGPHADAWLDKTIEFLTQESERPEIGSDTIVTRLTEVMFVEAVRMWLKDQPEGSAGWLGALRDPAVGKALGLIHQAPQTRWTLPTLAAEVGMSRSPFAARFTALVGLAPMSYLQRWRLQVAASLLLTQAMSLSIVAERVGYDSAAAFSRAFTRQFGVAPGRYRLKPREPERPA